VVLNIDGDSAALEAFDRIVRSADGKDVRGVVIYPLVRNAQEVLVGLSRDPQFGPVVMCGLGGIYTEVWRDTSMRIAPVDQAEAWGMIRELRSFALLKGARGQEPRDLEALVNILVRVSRLPFAYPELGELDLNPVFVFAKGALVGDARVIRRLEKAQT
jgi:acyl-CoA synthetase (NDP forming)